MIFFLLFPFLALITEMLLAAALTFAISSTIPAFRHSAITAPIAAFLIAPALAFAAAPWTYGLAFITNPPIGSTAFWIRFGTATVLLLAACVFVAYLATLVCRAIFEFVPPWLSTTLGIRPILLLQVSILAGGSLSTLVLLAVSCLLVYVVRENVSEVLLCGIGGLSIALICVRGILRLSDPECYQPLPFPGWARTVFFANH